MLLVGRDAVPFAVIVELRRLGARGVVILGNEDAVSQAVADRLGSEMRVGVWAQDIDTGS
ncbi:hypothetical protein BH23ACT9_BH23ACT9_12060 [soil metagenome]